MAKLIFKNDYPQIELYENFLSDYECEEIKKLSKEKLQLSTVVDYETGSGQEKNEYRNSKNTSLDGKLHPVIKDIETRISKLFKIDQNRFEPLTVINYQPGEYFKPHHDFFHENPNGKNDYMKYGGNRVGTVLIYLNDVDEGGETNFPNLGLSFFCKKGNLIYFNYDYKDQTLKDKSLHQGVPTVSSEKWITTTWIREGDLQKEYVNKPKIISKFEINCGPEDDKKTISIALPENYNQNNIIVVGFTGGLKSSLLLYLIAKENLKQKIPYIIQPLCITSYDGYLPGEEIKEHWEDIKNIINLIKENLKTQINDIFYFSGPINVKNKEEQILLGSEEFFKLNTFNKMFFAGNVEQEIKNLKTPFLNLKEEHILDAIENLNLKDLLKKYYE